MCAEVALAHSGHTNMIGFLTKYIPHFSTRLQDWERVPVFIIRMAAIRIEQCSDTISSPDGLVAAGGACRTIKINGMEKHFGRAGFLAINKRGEHLHSPLHTSIEDTET